VSGLKEHPGLVIAARIVLLLLGILCLLVTVPQILIVSNATSLPLWFGVFLGVGLCVSSIFERPAGALVSFVLIIAP
jgi:hypothetical protein